MAPNTTLELNLSVDGIPLHKSGRDTFWPVLMSVHGMPHIKPMTVAIFCGTSKPHSADEYLRRLVDELNSLMCEGIVIGRNQAMTEIRMRAFIADSPARSFSHALEKNQACSYAAQYTLNYVLEGYG